MWDKVQHNSFTYSVLIPVPQFSAPPNLVLYFWLCLGKLLLTDMRIGYTFGS
jgi:hypothetical protein